MTQEKATGKAKKEFRNSLDLTDEELEKYVPRLLQGLPELGSMPGYIVEIIEKNIKSSFSTVTDLGCGKGAVLIRLAQNFNFIGQGIDIVPEFINEARELAKKLNFEDKLNFKTEDFLKSIKNTKNQDILIYGYDSAILGDIRETLMILEACIKKKGLIILEFMFTSNGAAPIEGTLTETEMVKQIEENNWEIIDIIKWDKEKIKEVNKFNNEVITKNVNSLIALQPDKELLFKEYLKNQIAECREIEHDFTCATLLVRRKNN